MVIPAVRALKGAGLVFHHSGEPGGTVQVERANLLREHNFIVPCVLACVAGGCDADRGYTCGSLCFLGDGLFRHLYSAHKQVVDGHWHSEHKV